MKILAIGDFHGKFPISLRKEAKKADLILGVGDYANADKIRKIIFSNWGGKKWWEIIGIKKARKIEKESFDSGLKILKELNSINKKSYIIWGNTDFYKNDTISEPETIMPGLYDNKIKKMRNLILADKNKRKINGLELIGHGGYVDADEFIKKGFEKDKKKQKKRLKRYKKSEKKLIKLFLNNKPKKGFIFLIHHTPYGCFDKVKLKSSPMNNKHVGWSPYNKIIKKYKPSLVICGHMHEYQGKKKLGGATIIATGAAYEGKAALIELEKNKVKNVRFFM